MGNETNYTVVIILSSALILAICGVLYALRVWPFYFKRRLKSYLSDEKFKVVEAFKLNGKKYFMYEDATKMPSGRGLCALTIYEEFNMRMTKEYAEAHVRATEIILNSNPIKLTVLAQINQNMKERLQMAIFPEHVYKLASVIFFDESESPYSYDYGYNNKKIEEWKANGGTLDFFLKTPLKDLIPSLQLPEESAATYFQVSEMIANLHHTDLQEVLSSEG